jgi:hypothetical protein
MSLQTTSRLDFQIWNRGFALQSKIQNPKSEIDRACLISTALKEQFQVIPEN